MAPATNTLPDHLDHSIFAKNEVEGMEAEGEGMEAEGEGMEAEGEGMEAGGEGEEAEGEGEEEEGEGAEAEKGGNGELAAPLHVFRAADGSLQEEPEISDGDLMVVGSLDALYYEEVAIRRRLRLSHDKRIEIVYENTGSHRVEEATGEEDEEEEEVEEEEQEHVRPVHVFWRDDGALHEEEEDSTTSHLTRYDGGGEDDDEVAGLGNAGWREAAVDAAFGAAVDAVAEAELEYELEFAVRTRRAMAIGVGGDEA
ncbi:unnamed protein product [Closterium sp. NIES-65]|nr:unnamed protein product [Closterium sp. NIES-65]